MNKPIGITMGDANGVGPEILLKAFRHARFRVTPKIIFSSFSILSEVIKRMGKKGYCPQNIKIKLANGLSKNCISIGYHLIIVDGCSGNNISWKPGDISKQAGQLAGKYLLDGIKAAKSKNIRALVTLPINKKSFDMGGWGRRYRGHTEMLEDLTGTKEAIPMLLVGNMRAAHVTQHIPLSSVSKKINSKRIVHTIKLANDACKKMGIRKPKIAVCGLNPHAGDHNLIGNEDLKIILPAVNRCKKRGMSITGPLSPDILWPLVTKGFYDVGIAMYHDQGQIPVKLIASQFSKSKFGGFDGANITLGLPIIRTSVLHGTAMDIAGKGLVSERSFLYAFDLADRLSK